MDIEVHNNLGIKYNLSDSKAFDILKVTGLNPSTATINSSQSATGQGAIYSNSKLNQRNIVFTLNLRKPIEENRWKMYEIFQSGEKLRLYFSLGWRIVYIDGYVESIEFTQFDKTQRPVISIICPSPFLINGKSIKEDFITKGLRIYNDGVKVGARFTLTMLDAVTDPGITNTITGEKFVIEGNFLKNDVLTINSNEGVKTLTLTRNGVIQNWLGNASDESLENWIYINRGENIFKTSNTVVNCSIYAQLKYLGI